MTVILKDLNGNVFENCFLCGKDWECSNPSKIISCDACGIIASIDLHDEHSIWRTIDKYDVGYFKGNSNIIDNTKLYNNIIVDIMPLLPYDITLEKLKTLLLFI